MQGLYDPDGPSTQYLRFLVPKTIPYMVLVESETSHIGYLDFLG